MFHESCIETPNEIAKRRWLSHFFMKAELQEPLKRGDRAYRFTNTLFKNVVQVSRSIWTKIIQITTGESISMLSHGAAFWETDICMIMWHMCFSKAMPNERLPMRIIRILYIKGPFSCNVILYIYREQFLWTSLPMNEIFYRHSQWCFVWYKTTYV